MISILEKAQRKYEKGRKNSAVTLLDRSFRRASIKYLVDDMHQVVLNALDELIAEMRDGLETAELRGLIVGLDPSLFKQKSDRSKFDLLRVIDQFQKALDRRSHPEIIHGKVSVLVSIQRLVRDDAAETLISELNKIIISLQAENETRDLVAAILNGKLLGWFSGFRQSFLLAELQAIQHAIDKQQYNNALRKLRRFAKTVEENFKKQPEIFEILSLEIEALENELSGNLESEKIAQKGK